MENIFLDEILNVTGGTLIYKNICKTDNVYISSVCSNSNKIEKGALFVPVVGERVDAHDFIGMAFEAGATVSLASHDVNTDFIPDGCFVIKVSDTLLAIQKLAGWYRRKFDIPVIGVTGSVGKTTTKEMIAAALSAGLNVLKTEGNQNSQLGVALMMFQIELYHEVAVIEMGISEHGEMVKLADIAKPTAAVVTNIGVSHIGQLGSKNNILREKLNIVTGFKEESGNLYLCGNDELLAQMRTHGRIELYPDAERIINKSHVELFGSNSNCEYKAYNILNKDEGTSFDIDILDGKELHVQLGVPGIHNVHNAAAALAIAKHLGVDLNNAAKKLNEYRPLAMRGQILVNNGITIIDDTYNSSPDSMKSGLMVLWDKKCDGRRYAVLADVLELGKDSEVLHREVGKYIVENYLAGRKTDELVTVGKEAGFISYEAKCCSGITVNAFADRDSAVNYLKENLSEGDLVIIKGSRGMNMDIIVNELQNVDLA